MDKSGVALRKNQGGVVNEGIDDVITDRLAVHVGVNKVTHGHNVLDLMGELRKMDKEMGRKGERKKYIKVSLNGGLGGRVATIGVENVLSDHDSIIFLKKKIRTKPLPLTPIFSLSLANLEEILEIRSGIISISKLQNSLRGVLHLGGGLSDLVSIVQIVRVNIDSSLSCK